MNIFIVTKLARQVEGDYVFLQVLGAFTTQNDVNQFLKDKGPRQSSEVINGVPCVVEIGVIENVNLTGDLAPSK